MATYFISTSKFYDRVEAESDSWAKTIAQRRVRGAYQPRGESTYWVRVTVSDNFGRKMEFLEPIDPEPPECVPASDDLAKASREALERWFGRAYEVDGHLWIGLRQFLGDDHEDSEDSICSEEVCLRCGTLLRVNRDARDWATGTWGLRRVEYVAGKYARKLAEEY